MSEGEQLWGKRADEVIGVGQFYTGQASLRRGTLGNDFKEMGPELHRYCGKWEWVESGSEVREVGEYYIEQRYVTNKVCISIQY